MINCDHEDNNALINAFVFKHAVTIKRAYARTSWATGLMSLYSWRTTGHESQTVFGRFSQEARCGNCRYQRQNSFLLQTCNLATQCKMIIMGHLLWPQLLTVHVTLTLNPKSSNKTVCD